MIMTTVKLSQDMRLCCCNMMRAEDDDICSATNEVPHKGVRGNEKADRAAKVGTALQCEEEIATETGIRQEAKTLRAKERNRLQLTYRPLQQIDNRKRISVLAGILGNKGLKEWRYGIGKADSPECRWCGKAPENLTHIARDCQAWKRKTKQGAECLTQPGKGVNIAEILEWAGQD
ncbi:hypothetical protein BDZ91DRAFT_785151 [Kalaharituber pfeilii]|nr:hypothetical protein BDZ91DRAFT_785151 [Kalaharituber pfeilii]